MYCCSRSWSCGCSSSRSWKERATWRTIWQLTEKDLKTHSTRGNIYDRNGNVLAYNELAYNVTVQDNGECATTNDRNLMLLELVRILNKHGEPVEGSFEIAID